MKQKNNNFQVMIKDFFEWKIQKFKKKEHSNVKN